MSLPPPSLACAIADHKVDQIVRTDPTHPVLRTGLITIEDVRDYAQIQHDNSGCTCNRILCSPWIVHLDIGDTKKALRSFPTRRPLGAKRVSPRKPVASLFPNPTDAHKTVHLMFELEKVSTSSSPSRKHFADDDEDCGSSEVIVAGGSDDSFDSATASSHSSKRARLSAVIFVGNHTLQARGAIQTLPPAAYSTIDQLCETPGVFFVDKSFALAPVHNSTRRGMGMVLRRPPGFGMRTFLSMVSHFYDTLRPRAIFDTILPNDNEYGLTLPDWLVLRIDLASLSHSMSTVADSVRDLFGQRLCEFTKKYDVELEPLIFEDVEEELDESAISVLDTISVGANYNGFPICVIIENYNTPLQRCLPEERVALGKYLNFHVFLRLHQLLCLGSIGSLILAGHTEDNDEWRKIIPYVSDRYHDYTHDASMQESFGFTEAEIRELDGALEKNPDSRDVMQHLADDGVVARQFFDPAAPSRCILFSGSTKDVFPMQDVLEVLARRIGQPNRQ